MTTRQFQDFLTRVSRIAQKEMTPASKADGWVGPADHKSECELCGRPMVLGDAQYPVVYDDVPMIICAGCFAAESAETNDECL